MRQHSHSHVNWGVTNPFAPDFYLSTRLDAHWGDWLLGSLIPPPPDGEISLAFYRVVWIAVMAGWVTNWDSVVGKGDLRGKMLPFPLQLRKIKWTNHRGIEGGGAHTQLHSSKEAIEETIWPKHWTVRTVRGQLHNCSHPCELTHGYKGSTKKRFAVGKTTHFQIEIPFSEAESTQPLKIWSRNTIKNVFTTAKMQLPIQLSEKRNKQCFHLWQIWPKAAIGSENHLQLNVKDERALLRVVCAFLVKIWNTCIVRWEEKKKKERLERSWTLNNLEKNGLNMFPLTLWCLSLLLCHTNQ